MWDWWLRAGLFPQIYKFGVAVRTILSDVSPRLRPNCLPEPAALTFRAFLAALTPAGADSPDPAASATWVVSVRTAIAAVSAGALSLDNFVAMVAERLGASPEAVAPLVRAHLAAFKLPPTSLSTRVDLGEPSSQVLPVRWTRHQ
jgi:hypothetical protein